MKILFVAADKYLKQINWKDLTLVKFCLFSMGIICGMQIKGKHKRIVTVGALTVFLATYIPLMANFLPVLKNEFQQEQLDEMINIENE